MKNDKNFKDFDRKSAKAGFDRRAYEKMKKRKSRLRTEIDPEFEEELKKYLGTLYITFLPYLAQNYL